MSKEAYVYIMASHSLTLYVGMTTDFDGRILEHKQGVLDGFTKTYHCTRLVYYEIYDGPIAAISREKHLGNPCSRIVGSGTNSLPFTTHCRQHRRCRYFDCAALRSG